MRLFIGLVPDDELKARLLNEAGLICRAGADGRVAPAANLHCTLAFIGETDRADEAEKAMDACAGFRAFCAETERLAVFGSSWKDIVVMLKEDERLFALQAELKRQLSLCGLSYDRRPFAGHITLIRKAKVVTGFRTDFPHLPFFADSIVLFSSANVGGSMIYSPLYAVRLASAEN